MEKVKIIFCGTGLMGQMAHLKNYALLTNECEIIAVSDVIPGKAALVASRYGIPHAYDSTEELLQKHAAQADAIVAIGPFEFHGNFLPQVIACGKPFIIEKPLSNSVPTAEKFVKMIKEANSRCMVAYNKRSDPATMWAKAEIDRLKQSNELGKLRYVKSIMPPGDWIAAGFRGLIKLDGTPTSTYVRDPADPEYGEVENQKYYWFVNYYIHQVNLIRHFLGEDYDFKFVDSNNVLLVGNSNSGVTVSLEMAAFQSSIDWQESITACFERGWVQVELPAPLAINRPGKVTVYRDLKDKVPTTEIPTMPWNHSMYQQAINFLKFVRGEMPAMADEKEALKDLVQAKQYIELAKKSGIKF